MNKVYDMTKFLDEQPDGKKVVMKVVGTDASKQFDKFHTQTILDKYTPQLLFGIIGDGADASLTAQEDQIIVEDQYEDGAGFGDMVPFGDPAWYQDYESPYYTDKHRRVRSEMRKFVDKHIAHYCFEWDENKHS